MFVRYLIIFFYRIYIFPVVCCSLSSKVAINFIIREYALFVRKVNDENQGKKYLMLTGNKSPQFRAQM